MLEAISNVLGWVIVGYGLWYSYKGEFEKAVTTFLFVIAMGSLNG